jgi:phosphohistidine phosphatase SixA
MKLFIVRHGEASAASGTGDEPGLTATGLEQAKLAGQLLFAEDPGLLLHSPKLRAWQTAQQLLDLCPAAACQEAGFLLPSATAYDVMPALEVVESQGVAAVVLVSHLPLVDELVGWFVHGDLAETRLPGFTPAGVVALELKYIGPQEARLLWYAFAPGFDKKKR